MPRWRISPQSSRGWSCCPAIFRDGHSQPRQSYEGYFGRQRILSMESSSWGIRQPDQINE
jgi:hypothetical protein